MGYVYNKNTNNVSHKQNILRQILNKITKQKNAYRRTGGRTGVRTPASPLSDKLYLP